MDYLIEISRIVDGAVKGERKKVAAYLEQLIRKLKENGDAKSAEYFQGLFQGNIKEVTLSGVNGVSPRLPVDSESRLALADEHCLSVGDVVIILDDLIKSKINEFLLYIKSANKLSENNVGIAPSMLIYGPPGVGKTELARYIASQLKLPLLTARTDSLISSFLGSTAKNLRLLFEHATSRPCVLFLDEFDAIAKLRDDQYELGELKRVVVSLLQNIDALDSSTILVAATNHQHLLDSAIWRRFSYKVELNLPSVNCREKLFKLFLNKYVCSNDQISVLANVAEGISGSDIKYLSENAIRNAVLARKKKIDIVALIKELIQFKNGQQLSFSIKSPQEIKIVKGFLGNSISQELLASIFNTSKTTVSRRLKETEGAI